VGCDVPIYAPTNQAEDQEKENLYLLTTGVSTSTKTGHRPVDWRL